MSTWCDSPRGRVLKESDPQEWRRFPCSFPLLHKRAPKKATAPQSAYILSASFYFRMFQAQLQARRPAEEFPGAGRPPACLRQGVAKPAPKLKATPKAKADVAKARPKPGPKAKLGGPGTPRRSVGGGGGRSWEGIRCPWFCVVILFLGSSTGVGGGVVENLKLVRQGAGYEDLRLKRKPFGPRSLRTVSLA